MKIFSLTKLVKVFLFVSLLTNLNYSSAGLLDAVAGPLLRPIIRSLKDEPTGSGNRLKSTQESGYVVNPGNITENFSNIIVDDEVKNNFNLVLEFLKNPSRLNKIGATIPKGILLYGPPGTGKTSLGRALAKESNSNFIYFAAPDIEDKWVGGGAEKIREIFDLAKNNAPTIIFIDEIDTIAKKRDTRETRHHQQTMQQFLVEMDGFKKSDKPIIVIATTNQISQLDPAILRSGRFDIHLEIGNPNLENRKKIFSKYLGKVRLSPSINPDSLLILCNDMNGFSGADIENLVNKSALHAAIDHRETIDLADIKKAIQEVKKTKNKI